MIEPQKRAEQAEAMVAAWTQVGLAWHAVDRCSRYRPQHLTAAAQLARAAEDCAKEGDIEGVEFFFTKVRPLGHPE